MRTILLIVLTCFCVLVVLGSSFWFGYERGLVDEKVRLQIVIEEELEAAQNYMILQAVQARGEEPYRFQIGGQDKDLGLDDDLCFEVPDGYYGVIWREGETIHVGYTQ